jgi:hypothetical protein
MFLPCEFPCITGGSWVYLRMCFAPSISIILNLIALFLWLFSFLWENPFLWLYIFLWADSISVALLFLSERIFFSFPLHWIMKPSALYPWLMGYFPALWTSSVICINAGTFFDRGHSMGTCVLFFCWGFHWLWGDWVMESTVNQANCFSVLGELVIDSTVIQTEINLLS